MKIQSHIYDFVKGNCNIIFESDLGLLYTLQFSINCNVNENVDITGGLAKFINQYEIYKILIDSTSENKEDVIHFYGLNKADQVSAKLYKLLCMIIAYGRIK